MNLTLEQVDAAIAEAAGGSEKYTQDDVALLWFYRAGLTHMKMGYEELMNLMEIDEEEALDTIARLSERGLIATEENASGE